MSVNALNGKSLVNGNATGKLLHSAVALSFWGGVDPSNGIVIDQHHPLSGQHLNGNILAIPSSRGSSSGSGVLLELLLNNLAPAALIFSEPEEILTLGVVVSRVLFGKSIPAIQLSAEDFAVLDTGCSAKLENEKLFLFHNPPDDSDSQPDQCIEYELAEGLNHSLTLSKTDRAILGGDYGKAAQVAMQVVTQMATIQGAPSLIDISQAHIDACVYNGPSGLRFAQQLLDYGARVCVPTTLNSISVDQRRWQQHEIDPEFAEAASALGDTYVAMGAKPSFTCAPYLLDTAPAKGEQIVWAESNAVVYANSVLGARTQKYADFMEVCIALTGRAPGIGSHLDTGRLPSIAITVEPARKDNDAYWALLGYHTGTISGFHIPMIYGLEQCTPSADDLKAFCAAFATSSSAAMAHISGVTPESAIAHQHLCDQNVKQPARRASLSDLLKTFHQLNTARGTQVDMICLGNPHFSLTECASLARLCDGKTKHNQVRMVVTLGRTVHERAVQEGYVKILENFGVQFITDTCWCMITAPLVPPQPAVLMTNSGKYAHYAPGLVGQSIYFDSLQKCVDAACTGSHTSTNPDWLCGTTNTH